MRLQFGPDGPVADAKAAAKAGDFRMIWSIALGGRGPMDVACNGPIENTPGDFYLAVVADSDLLPDPCHELAGACEYNDRLWAYGPIYNRTLVDQPEFPFADVCRPATNHEAFEIKQTGEGRYARPIREAKGAPHDLHEAARRGSMAQVKRAMRDHGVDEYDAFGYTPLAWAVVRGRPDVVARLLAAGAQPSSREATGDQPAPLWLAYRFACTECAKLMLPKVDPAWLDMARPSLLEIAEKHGSAELVNSLKAGVTK